jgi:methyltransferase family protein
MTLTTQSQLERYRRGGHKSVDGWLEPGAVEMIVALNAAQLTMGIAGHVGEIGVYHGRLFILLSLLRRPGEKALALDLFDLGEMHADATVEGDRQTMMANLARHASSSGVLVQQADSTQLSGSDVISFVGGKFRLFSVDGGHTLEVVGHDLATAESSLELGGILIQDDFFNEEWPDVATATLRYFSQPRGIVPFAVGGNKVMFSHPEYAVKYRTVLQDLPGADKWVRRFMGSDVLCLSFKTSLLQRRVRGITWWPALRNTSAGRMARRVYHRLRF